ncbi:hypothetical protein FSARC_9002 [Fusarium sarcochroum]|uniref:Nephrocystin 3-like N-terminal domain-containing protein n=1 Tax=Fusarium sarcochroum TaxID=1208366 RepID=A0A8H4TRS8_9HYPO|nr:hypothetical protein FSARC_9002 [Fusarium sarcochroum]
MAGPRESDGGCLSIISSCFRNSAKTRPEASRSPNRTSTPKVSEPLAPEPLTDQIHASTHSTDEASIYQRESSREHLPARHETKQISHASASDQELAPTLDLWQEACNDVDETTRTWIRYNTGRIDIGNSVPELVKLVQRTEEKHEKKAWRVNIGEREIVLRDYTSRVTSWLTTIGDLAITFAPAPSPVIWSAVKANVSQCEDLVAVMGCTDMVLCLVRRGKVYEEVYLNKPSDPPVYEDLKQKLVSVYKACLEFLAFVDEELRHGNLRHFFDALLNPGHGGQHFLEMKDLEKELELAAHACEVQSNQARSEEHQKLLQSLQAPLMRIDGRVTAVLAKLEEYEKEKIMEHISTIPVGIHHNEKHESRTKGTCEWLIRHPNFREWEDSSCSSVLWLQGSIGTGKSFLSSKVIDRYLAYDKNTNQRPSEHDEGFAFFYCNRSDLIRRETSSILRSYIRQLSNVPSHSESLHKAVIGLYKDSKEVQSSLTLEKCRSTLVEIIDSYPRTILVLDALDECDETTKQDLAKLFQYLVQNTKSLLKVFIASRKEPDIEQYLEAFQSPQMLVSINALDNSGDIERFVTDEMAKFAVNWKFITDDTKLLAKTTLVEKGDGMFRWTYLQWEQLKKCRIDTEIRRRLDKIQKLPKTLSAAYDELYDRYEPDDFQLVILQRAVRWVIIESEKVDGQKALGKSDLTEQTLEWVCQHLIVKDTELKVWKFPHASVGEYFKNKQESWIQDAPAEITICLINCLIDSCAGYPSVWPPPTVRGDWERAETSMGLDRVVRKWLEARDANPNEISDPRHPLQKYIQKEWLNHVKDVSDQDLMATGVAHALKRFLGENDPQQSSEEYQVFCTFILCGQRWYHDRIDRIFNAVKPSKNPTFGIIAMGLYRLLAGWWDQDLDSSQANDAGRDLLAIAAQFGHKDVCEDLINRGFDVNRRVETTFLSPLSMAILHNEFETTKLLLAKGANPNLIIGTHTFLCLAVNSGKEYVEILFEFEADPNLQCGTRCEHRCALSVAAWYGKVGAMEALIRNGAEVNPTFTNFQADPPLVAAVKMPNFDCVRILVEHGADVNVSLDSTLYGSILAAVVGNGEVDLAQLLIRHGAHFQAQLETGRYGSILATATFATHSSLAMIKFLIEDAHVELEQLVWEPPQEGLDQTETEKFSLYWGARPSERNRVKRAEYLINEQQVEAQMLVDIGLLRPTEVVDNAIVISATTQSNLT